MPSVQQSGHHESSSMTLTASRDLFHIRYSHAAAIQCDSEGHKPMCPICMSEISGMVAYHGRADASEVEAGIHHCCDVCMDNWVRGVGEGNAMCPSCRVQLRVEDLEPSKSASRTDGQEVGTILYENSFPFTKSPFQKSLGGSWPLTVTKKRHISDEARFAEVKETYT